jgi:hypothetical protein
VTEATVQWKEELLRTDRKVMMCSVTAILGCSQWFRVQHSGREFEDSESMHTMVAWRTEGSRYNEPNGSVLATCLRYADEGEDMLNMIVIWDESCVQYYEPESKLLQCNGNIPVHLQLKCLLLILQHLGSLSLHCFRILKEDCSPIFRSVVRM